jgi:hypothetical protein
MKPAFACLLIVTALCIAAPSQAREQINVAQWSEDIDVYQSQLEALHIDIFHTLTRKEFEQQLKSLRRALPTLSDAQVVANLMRITRLVGDGHTAMPLWNSAQPRFPVEFRSIEGQIVITGVQAGDADLLGAVVTHWNGRDIDEVRAVLARYVPFVENAGSQAVRVAQYLNYAELGSAIGLGGDARTLTLEVLRNGKARRTVFEAIDAPEFSAAITRRITYRRDLSVEPSLIHTDGLRFALLSGGEVGYLQFDRYPSIAQMDDFAQAMTRALQEAGVRNLIIDFRENFGGDFFVGLALAADLVVLDDLDWRDGIYVLTSSSTFSAAMSNTAQFSAILNARIFGEPTGGKPCGYQDMGQFSLPNSGYLVTYSKRRFCFAEPLADAIEPDVRVSTSLQDYRDGSDPVLARVIREIEARAEGTIN